MDTTSTSAPTLQPSPDGVARTLSRLLDAELAYDTDARHGFVNHLAMGLTAATRLGADEAILERWFRAEVADGYLLDRPAAPSWLAEGIQRVESRGIDAEVRAAVGDLVDRVGGFFHWMIRLELAIDAGHPGQVANALGDWARRPRLDPTEHPAPTGRRTVADVLASDRPVVADVADHDDLLGEIAAAVADLHWATADFVSLHMVTGTRAARALVPFLDGPGRRRLAHAHLHAVAGAMSRVARPEGPPEKVPDVASLPGWSTIGTAAIATGDDHVVKLVYAAQLEEAATARPIYRAIAARAAKAT